MDEVKDKAEAKIPIITTTHGQTEEMNIKEVSYSFLIFFEENYKEVKLQFSDIFYLNYNL